MFGWINKDKKKNEIIETEKFVKENKITIKDLYIGKMELISSKIYEEGQPGPMCINSDRSYLFIKKEDKYMEVFSEINFEFDISEQHNYFDIPFIVDIVSFKDLNMTNWLNDIDENQNLNNWLLLEIYNELNKIGSFQK